MARITRQGDFCSGHDACAPTPLSTCSPDIFANGRGIGRVGDTYAAHGCVTHSGHQDRILSGSPTVFANGMPVGRVGDSVAIDGYVRDGSSDVFVGG